MGLSAVPDFWFSRSWDDWWQADPAFDAEIRDRFHALWESERENEPEHFLTDPETALAAIILFDQFPRNMFRGHADQFSTDPLALAIAKGAVERGHDDGMTSDQRGFLYMPFQHSENLADQNRALLLFTALGDDEQIKYAKHHRDIIERFGRFPHRNAILGRPSRPAEIESGADKAW